MNGRKDGYYRIKGISTLAVVFLILVLLTKLHYMPITDKKMETLRDFFVGASVMLLMVLWFHRIRIQVAQKTIRLCLIAQSIVMLVCLYDLFLQTVLETDSIVLIYLCGNSIIVSIVLFPWFGFCASLGLGMPDSWRLPKGIAIGFVSTIAMCILAFLNVFTGNIYEISFVEDAGRIVVLPHFLTYIFVGWAVTITILRLLNVCRYSVWSQHIREMVMMLTLVAIATAYSLYNFSRNFIMDGEIIYNMWLIMYVEILFWEIPILSGMIPVNREYGMAFNLPKLDIAITDCKGDIYKSSNDALAESWLQQAGRLGQSVNMDNMDNMEKLTGTDNIFAGDGIVICRNALSEHKARGYVLWKEDRSLLNRLKQEIKDVHLQLTKRQTLLEKELQRRDARERKNWNQQISHSLEKLNREDSLIIESLIDEAKDYDKAPKLIGIIMMRMIFIKRKSNLLLSENRKDIVRDEELVVILREISDTLSMLGCFFEVFLKNNTEHSTGEVLNFLDILQNEVVCILEEGAKDSKKKSIKICEECGKLKLSAGEEK